MPKFTPGIYEVTYTCSYSFKVLIEPEEDIKKTFSDQFDEQVDMFDPSDQTPDEGSTNIISVIKIQ